MEDYLAVGDEGLGESIQDREKCPVCGSLHEIQYGTKILKDGTRVPSKLLAFIKCPVNGKCYLVGIAGKRLQG